MLASARPGTRPGRRLPTARSLLAATLGAVIAVGCYGGGATPSPGGTAEVMQELARGGLRIEGAVAGDAGCGSTSLTDNAAHLRVSLPPDPAVHDLYLFTFRSSAYEGGGALVDECQAIVQAAGSVALERLDVAPFRAFGDGWTRALRDVVASALAAAARGV